MVVNDAPALGKLAEYQREHAVQLLAIGHGEVKGAAHESGRRAQAFNLQVGKVELAHLPAF